MIVVYPMLVSSNVSANVLPGISKVIEKFILIYKMDDIVKSANDYARGKRSLFFKKGMLKLSEDYKNNHGSFKDEIILEQGIKPPSVAVTMPTQEKDKKISQGEKATVKIDVKVDPPNFKSVSLEPTWIKVDTFAGTRIAGIKTIPFPVKSDAALIDLILSDQSMNFLESRLSIIERKILRMIWAVVRWTHLPFTQLTISGDPKKDVIMARTVHKNNIFTVFNMMDLGYNFLERTNNIRRLYSLGWNSFVICDDVNKRAFFCMKEFSGLCSSIQYSFIYAALGSEYGKVFDDLEDIKKSSSPFFKLMKKPGKIISESTTLEKLDKYLF